MNELHYFLQPAVSDAASTVQGDLAPQPGDPESVPTTLSGLFRWVAQAVLAPMLRMQQALSILNAKFADMGPRLALAEATLASTQTALAANTAADQLVAAKATLTESATRANTLDIAALKLQATADEAATAALQVRATADEAAIALAQQAANTAQFAANTARAEAATAQAKAEADATLALAAKAASDVADAKATTVQNALNVLAGRFRTIRVATPQVPIAGTMSVAITWPTPFADANYNAVAEFEGLSVLGLTAVVTNRTATGCTVTSKNVLGLALLAGAGTLTVTAIHDAA